MKQVLNEKPPIKLWIDWSQVEDKAKEQIMNLTKLPFAFHHVAIMPDIQISFEYLPFL